MEGESSMPTAPPPSTPGGGTPAAAGAYKRGGRVKKTGPALLHKGEVIIRAKRKNSRKSTR